MNNKSGQVLGNESPTGWSATLGRLAVRWPWWVLGVWVVIAVLAVPNARKAPAMLYGGSGDIAGSASLRTDSLLKADFENPYSQLLVLAIHGGSALGADSQTALIRRLEKSLSALPQVGAVMTSEQVLDKRLLPAPGTGAMLLIGVKASTVRDAERALPIVRDAVNEILNPVRQIVPGLNWAVTGRSALTLDMNTFNAKDTGKAEKRVFPLTLLILLAAFGSLAAAGVPLVLGVLCTTISMGLVYFLARHWALSNLVQNVSSMIGLAVGIDYSLIILHRYREALNAKLAASGFLRTTRQLRGEALVESMATAGKAVFYSGLTVMIGLGGMLLSPLMETSSIGWGGCLVVLVTLAAALTFLPALLMVLGPVLDWPKALSRRFANTGPNRRWEAWSHWVMRNALLSSIIGLALIALLSWPARYTHFGFPEGPFIPAELEFSHGYRLLEDMGLQGLVRPVNIVLTAKDGGTALTTDRIAALYAFSERIRSDSSVQRIFGPVDLADGWPLVKYQYFYTDVNEAFEKIPGIRDSYVSRDGKSLFMQVIFKKDVSLEQAKRLIRDIPGWLKIEGLGLDLGGQAVYYSDYDKVMAASYPPSMGFVLIVTFVALLLFFRSPVVAIKALIMNALSVLAGYGVVVYVFQLGHGSWIFGAPGPTELVPLAIPIMLFCILFGLSMDYEVFLISRIREGFLKTGDNTDSVAHGVAATGPIITSAALIMAAVFGAFAFARVSVVQMLGLGLAASVLIDATIIRVLLVPAFMKLAGRWNWWPYHRGKG